MKKLLFLSMSICILIFLIISCSAPARTVTRVETSTVTDLSGRWNDTDAKLVSQEMISDLLSRAWLSDYKTEKGKKPVVIVGTVRNKSSEHINTELFTKEIEKELINSGKVTFVASKSERMEIREERIDQQYFASVETAKELANETGADFMLIGSINSVVDAIEGQKAILYKTNMELIDLETNTKAWIGDKEIKKIIEQKKHKW
jgi:uncharacterized protein (TIGR02722 family)